MPGKHKKRKRRLWLNVTVSGGVSGVSKAGFIRTLLESIQNKTYKLPAGWDVSLEWKNKETADMKSGAWSDELAQSAKSSSGFDIAVKRYLERALQREEGDTDEG